MAYAESGNASNAPCLQIGIRAGEHGDCTVAASWWIVVENSNEMLWTWSSVFNRLWSVLLLLGFSNRSAIRSETHCRKCDFGTGRWYSSAIQRSHWKIDFYDGISYFLPRIHSDRPYDRGRYGIGNVMARTGESFDQLGFPYYVRSRPRGLLPHHRCSSR